MHTVYHEGLAGKKDSIVWEAAQDEHRFFITQDLDFSDRRRFEPGRHYGLLLLRLREPGRLALQDRVSWLFAHEAVDQWPGCFIVATDHKLRIQTPKS